MADGARRGIKAADDTAAALAMPEKISDDIQFRN